MFPSTSSTHTPLARSATSLKSGRGYEGVTNCASAAIISRPFGPGSGVLISGLRGGAIVLADMAFLLFKNGGPTMADQSESKISRRSTKQETLKLVSEDAGTAIEGAKVERTRVNHK